MELNILYEDKEIVVVVKPIGMPSQPDKTGDMDLLTALEQQTKTKLFLVHRLDRPVGGVMVFAKTKTSAGSLSKNAEQFSKEYVAVICGEMDKEKGILTDFLLKNARTNMSCVVPEKTKGAKQAILEYDVRKKVITEDNSVLSFVYIHLITGRHHQIRVQLSNVGTGIWGDKKYNPLFQQGRVTQIALWAEKIVIRHPVSGKYLEFTFMPDQYPFSLFVE